ncbi:MAG: hypothetical protein AABX70_00445 [Nanoarchaeota archaeon]
MAEILFQEGFDAFLKNLQHTTLIPQGKPKKHVLSKRDLKGEIGKQTILKDYDLAVDIVHILGTVNQFSGLGNVIVIESQGYKIQETTLQTSGL